jgi:hypothetical protein
MACTWTFSIKYADGARPVGTDEPARQELYRLTEEYKKSVEALCGAQVEMVEVAITGAKPE